VRLVRPPLGSDGTAFAFFFANAVPERGGLFDRRWAATAQFLHFLSQKLCRSGTIVRPPSGSDGTDFAFVFAKSVPERNDLCDHSGDVNEMVLDEAWRYLAAIYCAAYIQYIYYQQRRLWARGHCGLIFWLGGRGIGFFVGFLRLEKKGSPKMFRAAPSRRR